MSSSPRALSLEVWLGPMEGLKFLGDARGATQVVRIGRLQFDRQSKERNHLVLSAAQGVSGSHAEVRFVQNRILVRDLGSANGTFANQQAVAADLELKAGDIFLVSLTSILVGLAAPSVAPPPFEPVSVSNWEEPAWAEVLSLASEAAARRHERHIDTRHLCEALLRLPDEGLAESFTRAGWSREDALEELWTKEMFREGLSWISEILVKPVQMAQVAGGVVVVSPKVARFLDSARNRAGADAASASAGGLGRKLLASLVQDGQGPVGQWLVLRGVTTVVETSGVTVKPPVAAPERPFDPDETGPSGVHPREILLGLAGEKGRPGAGRPGSTTNAAAVVGPPPVGTLGGSTVGGESPLGQTFGGGRTMTSTGARPALVPPPAKAGPTGSIKLGDAPPLAAAPAQTPHRSTAPPEAPAYASIAPSPAQPSVPPPDRTPADLALEARAREIAATVFEKSAEYRFGAPADRRRAVKSLVQKELSPFSPAERRKLLAALREQFPVLPAGESAVSEDEVSVMRKRIADLERDLAQARAHGTTGRFKKPGAGASALPLAALISGEDLAAADRSVQVLRVVIEYALAMEGMTLGLVQSMTMPGNETVAFRLPNFRETLRGLLGLVEQGKPVSIERVTSYLDELKRWQVATLAAFHQGPTEWFEKLWRRINPATIESAPRSAGWKLRGETAEWWDMYKLAVRDLGPDVVHDQVLQTIARLSKEELDKLKRPH